MTLLSLYDHYLTKNPLFTKMLTNLLICCSGDIICQSITKFYRRTEEKLAGWDWVRTARFGAVGACVQTTLLHWYLTRVVPRIQFSQARFPNPTHY